MGEATTTPLLACPLDDFTMAPSLCVLMRPDDEEADGHVPTVVPDW